MMLANLQHPACHFAPQLRPDGGNRRGQVIVSTGWDVLGLLLEQGPEHPVVTKNDRVCVKVQVWGH